MKSLVIYTIVAMTCFSCGQANSDNNGGKPGDKNAGVDTAINDMSLKKKDSSGHYVDTSAATLPTDTAPYKRGTGTPR